MRTTWRRLTRRVKDTLRDFGEDEAITRAAALAFYAGLSFAPLLLLAVSVAALAGPDAQQELVGQVHGLLGPEAGRAVDLVVEGAERRPKGGWIGTVLGVLTLLVSAAGAFAQLQESLNRVWDVKAKPGLGFAGWLRRRLFSFGMVLAVVFLLVVSLAVSAGVALVFAGRTGWAWEALNLVVSLVAFTGVFALLFRFVPDARIPWRVVRVGAFVTAVLFLLGKTAIGIYLGRGAVGSAYGAAGSLVVLLVWVYYCSIVLFLGAEATQTEARHRGIRVAPNRYAVHEEVRKEEEPA